MRHSQGHAVIVRMFFLLESLRGNGTKLFTSLKHNPAEPEKSVPVNVNIAYNSVRKDLKVLLHIL